MNFLAHALLAGDDAELEVGGVLGDFTRGPIDPGLSQGLRAGIALHRAIDSFTDGHAEVAAARRLFGPPWRRYAPIMLDVWFDHCLARDFASWSDTPLREFSARLRARLHGHDAWLPERLRRFVAVMEANDLPAAYADPDIIEQVLAGLGRRLSRTNPLHRALPPLRQRDAELQQHFRAFFPQLQRFAADWRCQRVTHS